MLLAKITALILAAGRGKRMGGRVSKQFLEVEGRPLLTYTLAHFEAHPLIDSLIIVVPAANLDYCREIVKKYSFKKVEKLVAGGKERQDSVYQGLKALTAETEWVVIHDGVRPLISPFVITQVIKRAKETGAAVVGVPVKDTIKMVKSDLSIAQTPPREKLWQAQTPQVFTKELIVKAYQKAKELGWQGTDDASLVEKLGVPVFMVPGEYHNLKITTSGDLVFLREKLKEKDFE